MSDLWYFILLWFYVLKLHFSPIFLIISRKFHNFSNFYITIFLKLLLSLISFIITFNYETKMLNQLLGKCQDIYFIHLWNKVKMLVAQLCLTLWDHIHGNCSLPDPSVHGILQARILEWVVMPSSRGSSWPRDQIQDSCRAGRLLSFWATREALIHLYTKTSKKRFFW